MSIDRERLARAYDKGFQEAGRRIAAPFDRFDKFEQQMLLQAIDAVISDIASQGYVIVPEHSIAGPAAWLDRWAEHVGSCKGGDVCTCGLTRARYDMNAPNPEQTEQ